MTQSGIAGHPSPEQLSAFVDHELPMEDMEAIERHLVDCHACTLQVLQGRQLKSATANAARNPTVPADALTRLTAQIQQSAPKKKAKVYSFASTRWAALAACLLLAASLIGWRVGHQTDVLSAELLDQHLAALSSGAAPEVISTDRHTVKPWFQGKLPFSFNLPEVLPADTVLKGGNLAYVGGQPAAMLLFTIHKHEVSVFLTQRTGHDVFGKSSVTRSGFKIHNAATEELHFVAVSDVNLAELDALVAVLVRAQQPGR
jgi:anti-sigma factor RsiW